MPPYWSIGVGTTVVAVAFGVRWAALEPPVGPFPQTGSKQARGQQVPHSGMSRGVKAFSPGSAEPQTRETVKLSNSAMLTRFVWSIPTIRPTVPVGSG
jgi:hypothetical protein